MVWILLSGDAILTLTFKISADVLYFANHVSTLGVGKRILSTSIWSRNSVPPQQNTKNNTQTEKSLASPFPLSFRKRATNSIFDNGYTHDDDENLYCSAVGGSLAVRD